MRPFAFSISQRADLHLFVICIVCIVCNRAEGFFITHEPAISAVYPIWTMEACGTLQQWNALSSGGFLVKL